MWVGGKTIHPFNLFMIKEIIASTMLATTIGIQNATSTTTKYISWQPTNAQKIEDSTNNNVFYLRYINTTSNYENEIIEINQNTYYQLGWKLSSPQKCTQIMYVITEVIPNEDITGTYQIKNEQRLNDTYYNQAYSNNAIYQWNYKITYTDLSIIQKTQLENLLNNNNNLTITYDNWTDDINAIDSIINAGTETSTLSNPSTYIGSLNQQIKINTINGNYEDGRTIYIAKYNISYNGLVQNINPQQFGDCFDPLMWIPSASQYKLDWTTPEQTGEIVDIPGIMFTMLGMPFAFVAQAFDLTIFPGTPYAVNLSHIFLAIAGAGILLFIIKKVIK